jgi:hypothetical protein
MRERTDRPTTPTATAGAGFAAAAQSERLDSRARTPAMDVKASALGETANALAQDEVEA